MTIHEYAINYYYQPMKAVPYSVKFPTFRSAYLLNLQPNDRNDVYSRLRETDDSSFTSCPRVNSTIFFLYFIKFILQIVVSCWLSTIANPGPNPPQFHHCGGSCLNTLSSLQYFIFYSYWFFDYNYNINKLLILEMCVWFSTLQYSIFGNIDYQNTYKSRRLY